MKVPTYRKGEDNTAWLVFMYQTGQLKICRGPITFKERAREMFLNVAALLVGPYLGMFERMSQVEAGTEASLRKLPV